jgi:hypothetical protein
MKSLSEQYPDITEFDFSEDDTVVEYPEVADEDILEVRDLWDEVTVPNAQLVRMTPGSEARAAFMAHASAVSAHPELLPSWENLKKWLVL